MRLLHNLRIKVPCCGTYDILPTSPTIPCRPGHSKTGHATFNPPLTSTLPPDTPIKNVILKSWRRYEFQGSEALTQWLNARWRKSGYVVLGRDVEVVLRGAGDMEGLCAGGVAEVVAGGLRRRDWDEVFVRRVRVLG